MGIQRPNQSGLGDPIKQDQQTYTATAFTNDRKDYPHGTQQESGYNLKTLTSLINGGMPAETISKNVDRISSFFYPNFPDIKVLDGPQAKENSNDMLYPTITGVDNKNLFSSLNTLLKEQHANVAIAFVPSSFYPESFKASFGQNMDISTDSKQGYLVLLNQGKLNKDSYSIVIENELREVRDTLKARKEKIDPSFIATKEYQVASLIVSHLKERTSANETYSTTSILRYASELYAESASINRNKPATKRQLEQINRYINSALNEFERKFDPAGSSLIFKDNAFVFTKR